MLPLFDLPGDLARVPSPPWPDPPWGGGGHLSFRCRLTTPRITSERELASYTAVSELLDLNGAHISATPPRSTR